jgi:hypothetical protein
MKRTKSILTIALMVWLFMLAFPSSAFAQVPDPVDDIGQDIEFAIDELWYSILLLHSQVQWFLMKTFFVLGIVIDLVTQFLAESAFAPLISQSNSQFGIAVSMSFTIAMLVLGLSYMVAHFIRLNVVEFKSAFLWYVLVALFFQLGPARRMTSGGNHPQPHLSTNGAAEPTSSNQPLFPAIPPSDVEEVSWSPIVPNTGSSPIRIGAPSPTTPTSQTTATLPITMSGYDPSELHPDSTVGHRTSRIPARFTPLDINEGAAPLAQTQARLVMSEDIAGSEGGNRWLPSVGEADPTSAQRIRDDAAEQARLTADNARDDTALRSTIDGDNARDETLAQARQDADNSRDDAALRDTLNTTQPNQRLEVDTAGLEHAGRDLSAAANALKSTADQQHLDRVTGQMDVTGSSNVGAVVADAVDMEREYRQRMGKPMLEGAGESFGGRMAQAVGVEPLAGQVPITEAARFHALGDQALRLGLGGGHVYQVVQEQSVSEDGHSISPKTHDVLVQQVRTETGMRQSEAQQRVGEFLTVAAAMPQEVRMTGSVARERIESNQENGGQN